MLDRESHDPTERVAPPKTVTFIMPDPMLNSFCQASLVTTQYEVWERESKPTFHG